jgi:opacity protein-like surface antigen
MARWWRGDAFALTAAAWTLAFAAVPAQAAELEKKWEVGAGIAYSMYDNDSNLNDNSAVSVRAGYHFGPHHGAELLYQIQSTDNSTRGVEIDYDVTRWAIDYTFDFKPKKEESRMAPLVLFGLGQMHWDTGDDSAGSTLIQAGGGVRVLFTKWLALRAEGRLFHYYGDKDLIPRDQFFGFDSEVGIVFFFGG